MGLLDQRNGFRVLDTGEAHLQIGGDAETAGRTRADADRGGDGGIVGDLHAVLVLRGDEFQRPEETGRIAGGKELFGIVAGAAAATEFLRRGEPDLE